ncbi:hypothetical protein [Fischerella sp. JS2]|uniref:hypothetical protein n=1 Tax=Fischerella sp. JS2 TaxID=2597771 RepID=UPI0028E6FA77|nr:hypothetical protein [Fischerella sp. JS2]
MLEKLRRSWVKQLLGESKKYFIVDTKPLPVLGLKRDKRYSDFAGNAARNPDRLLNKTVDGFCVHIAAKIASDTLRFLLRRRFGINVLTFQSQPL